MRSDPTYSASEWITLDFWRFPKGRIQQKVNPRARQRSLDQEEPPLYSQANHSAFFFFPVIIFLAIHSNFLLSASPSQTVFPFFSFLVGGEAFQRRLRGEVNLPSGG